MSALAEPAVSPPDLRSRILVEATRLFAERGYSATSVREVVEAAGCTKPALYYHFASKEGLFIEALRAETDFLTEMLEAGVSSEGSVRARMKGGLRTYFDHVRAYPMGLRLVYAEEGQPAFDLESVRLRHVTMIEGLLREAIAVGELRADVDLHDAALAFVGMVHHRVDLFLRGFEQLPDDLEHRLLDLFFAGVSP